MVPIEELYPLGVYAFLSRFFMRYQLFKHLVEELQENSCQ